MDFVRLRLKIFKMFGWWRSLPAHFRIDTSVSPHVSGLQFILDFLFGLLCLFLLLLPAFLLLSILDSIIVVACIVVRRTLIVDAEPCEFFANTLPKRFRFETANRETTTTIHIDEYGMRKQKKKKRRRKISG